MTNPDLAQVRMDDIAADRPQVSVDLMERLKESFRRHYGHSPLRPDYTPCGKTKSEVVVTHFPEQVTCGVCIEELKLQADKESAQ